MLTYEQLAEAHGELGSERKVAEAFGVGRKVVRAALGKSVPKLSGPIRRNTAPLLQRNRVSVEGRQGSGVYLLGSAQNDVPINENFMRALKRYADFRGAEILVSPVVYDTTETKNTRTKGRSQPKAEYQWDSRLADYLVQVPVRLADTFQFSASLTVRPTAVGPLSSIGFPPGVSSAVPHQKREMVCYPVSRYGPPVYRYTTGSVTIPRHIQRKEGQKAEFHYVLGVLVVEVDEDGAWFARQITADEETGTFYDLGWKVTKNGVSPAPVDHLVCGDIHYERRDCGAMDATFFDKDSMVEVLKPGAVILHDYLDGRSINHHADFKETFTNYAQGIEPLTLWKELMEARDGLKGIVAAAEGAEVVVTPGNHDQGFLYKWLEKADYRKDPANALMFLGLEHARLKALASGDDNPLLLPMAMEIAADRPPPDGVRFVGVDEGYRRCGIELGFHGDSGPNGARGTPSNLAKLAEKISRGHEHTPGIKEGVYTAGHLCARRQGYNRLPSSWDFANIIGFPDGHRQIVSFHENEDGSFRWRGKK